MTNKIIKITAHDVRFPTSEQLYGSDATNKDPDYSAAYVVIESEHGNRGYGLIFTIGRGNEICCAAIESMRHLVLGQDLRDIKNNIGHFYDHLRSDSQLQWLGPEKGVIHMALGCIVNAIWDMWAREEGKPIWRLLADMAPHDFVKCLDLRYVSDVLTENEALEILQRNALSKPERIEQLLANGWV